ncbi:MAG: CBS domain-containing protein [Chloroflexi bacterium]|nr:CBS domain-containing protein [Chloroflexota bacterium]
MAGVDAILTHENADFDAVASLAAAKKLYPSAVALLPRRLNRNVRDFLTLYGDPFPFVLQEQAPRRRFKSVLLVDTQTLPSARGLTDAPLVHILDHHPLARPLDERTTYSGGETGATTTLLVETLREKNLPLSRLETTLLALGIYEDTGSLTYIDTTPRDLQAVAYLVEHGVSFDLLGEFLHQPLAADQRALYNQLLKRAETHEIGGQTVVIAAVRVQEYVEEISTLAQQLMQLHDPSALFLLVQMGAQIQLVARSKSEAVDVAEIARAFGGGGHATAAAALIHSRGLKTQQKKLLALLQEHIHPQTTVQDIMSYGVRVLQPDMTIAQAAEQARRWGHEGFPVVNKKKLAGVLTRREIDRALHHKLHKLPVARFMSAAVSVTPEDSVEHLQRVMTRYGLGQLPVVQDGSIVGIVTRTDLLKLYTETARPARNAEFAARLERALPRDLLSMVQSAAQLARSLGYSTYLVGGFVRDLLIGQANLDLDLVVEGDAIHLAQRLADQYGGRVHTHARFGTAIWLVDEKDKLHLDFATARTEFYEYPSALPDVERSSIKLDLHRRDFTINAMALCLDPERYGTLLDPYGGEHDLNRGLIRVLHNLSFIEDPTRILRAVRFEQRFGFTIEARTAQLIDDARNLLAQVSGQRLCNELDLICNEQEPERALIRLQALGVLERIQPNLKADAWLAQKFQNLRASHPPTPILYLGVLAYRLRTSEVRALSRRLRLSNGESEILVQVVTLRLLERQLNNPNLTPSRVVETLERFDDAALAVFAIATDSTSAQAYVDHYRAEWRQVQPALNGNDLKQLGLTPGPAFREILSGLRAQRLDGVLKTRAEEEAFVQAQLRRGAV